MATVGMAMDSARARFRSLVSRPEGSLNLAEAALLMAKEEYPRLDVESYLRVLDSFADEIKSRLPTNLDPRAIVAQLDRYLFDVQGFKGNSENYYDPRNSFLNEVMDRKLGIPITLSVVYMEVAWRLGLAVQGLSFPGHFLVRLCDGEGVVIDPFARGAHLDEAAMLTKLAQVFGRVDVEASEIPQFLAVATKRETLVRMLRNLRSIHTAKRDYEKTLGCIDRMLILSPDSATDIRDRGFVLYHLECFSAAKKDFLRYLQLAPDAVDAENVRRLATGLHDVRTRMN